MGNFLFLYFLIKERGCLFSSYPGRLTWVFALTGSGAGGCNVESETQRVEFVDEI